MKLISILSGKGFVMYNKELAHSVSVNGAIIFGQLCSSFESFSSKEMLTVRDGKEYFFLTAEVLEEETAFTYKQQLKVAKELEDAGYIETRVMGVPSKKYFHITDKIVNELLGNPRSDKREDLNTSTNPQTEPKNDDSSYDKRENLALTKGAGKPLQKGSTIKKKNKKEQAKNNINCNNFKELLTVEKFKDLLTDSCNEFYPKFSVGRYSKNQWNTLIEKFVKDTIESGRYITVPENKVKGFAYKCLEKIVDNSDYKTSEEYVEYLEVIRDFSSSSSNSKNTMVVPFYNWLEQ